MLLKRLTYQILPLFNCPKNGLFLRLKISLQPLHIYDGQKLLFLAMIGSTSPIITRLTVINSTLTWGLVSHLPPHLFLYHRKHTSRQKLVKTYCWLHFHKAHRGLHPMKVWISQYVNWIFPNPNL